MLDYKAPTSITDLLSCLGLYRRVIKDFAAIAAPLHALTKQARSGQLQRTLKKEAKTTWSEGVWTEEHQKASQIDQRVSESISLREYCLGFFLQRAL